MRIVFNATTLLSPLSGIGQYSRQIAMGLVQNSAVDPEFFYGAFWSKYLRSESMRPLAHALPWVRSHVPGSYLLRRLVQHARFRGHSNSSRFDVYHEPNNLPLRFDGPTVVTVHDLSWIRYPHAHPAGRRRELDRYFEDGLRHSALVLTDSEFVKQELADVFGISGERVIPIALGADPEFRPMRADETRTELHKHQLSHGRYLLAVGTLEPRKNLGVALKAYLGLAPATRERYPLVVVGMKGWHTRDLDRQMEPLVHAGQLRSLGYLARDNLRKVIAGATALVYPSIYEGFGLPPLEAMACAVPVIASNVSSIPEVIGDSGILVDPHDVDALTEAMQNVVSDPQLREKLSAKALARSRHFSWAKCVDETIGAYRRVLTACS
jgi:glycosyltransferase involved in cell wall biosynthesis